MLGSGMGSARLSRAGPLHRGARGVQGQLHLPDSVDQNQRRENQSEDGEQGTPHGLGNMGKARATSPAALAPSPALA
jgi:hypothetical protein